ncbi:hypothetical protein C8Q74DRAFT_1367046 [Fomes fomentarius]|nr:hypothetical protein C8Q74DRAFT_1367046 [Fomes fomentarius]
MSFSTSSFCNPAGTSGGEGMNQQATPHSLSSLSTANGLQDVQQKSTIVRKAWAGELVGRILGHDGTHDEFMNLFVPCSEPYQPNANLGNPFESYKPKPGQEVVSYPNVLKGLNTLVDNFGDAKVTFVDSHSVKLLFPFRAFHKSHHVSYPDIAVSFPGKTLTKNEVAQSQWEKISLIIEVKPEKGQDPFVAERAGAAHTDTIIQVARNARNLMLTHGLLAAYVVGIYGTVVRLARFDHTAAVVSQPFDIHIQSHILQRFLWHFTHPVVDGPTVGWDPTVRRLDEDDRAWVKKWLDLLEEEVDNFEEDIVHGRRAWVFDERTGTMSPWILYRPVNINARLFSRATSVWRVIEDTRVHEEETGRLVDCETSGLPRVRIMKDSWRQVVRKSEASFYHRLADRIPEERRHGLTKLECGADLGQWEVRQWEQSSPNVSYMNGQRDLRLSPGYQLQTPDASRSSTPTLSSSSKQFPLPLPFHQTFSWTVVRGLDSTYRERSHMRFVMADIGRPITKFKRTRDLIGAFKDAIIGHKLACQEGKILHRDVSVGNILMVDKPENSRFKGFIHDFDYSSMEEELPELIEEEDDDGDDGDPDDWDTDDWKGDASGSVAMTNNALQKERTGTYYFMPVDMLLGHMPLIHTLRHDLESFYWVLLWVIFRHTKHSRTQAICEEIFVYGNDSNASHLKIGWLNSQVPHLKSQLKIAQNRPLTRLIRKYGALVCGFVRDQSNLDHDSVLALFDEALNDSERWPQEDDFVECTLLDKPKSQSLLQPIIPASRGVLPLPSLYESMQRSAARLHAGTRAVHSAPGSAMTFAPQTSLTSVGTKRRGDDAEDTTVTQEQATAGPSRLSLHDSVSSKRRKTDRSVTPSV